MGRNIAYIHPCVLGGGGKDKIGQERFKKENKKFRTNKVKIIRNPPTHELIRMVKLTSSSYIYIYILI